MWRLRDLSELSGIGDSSVAKSISQKVFAKVTERRENRTIEKIFTLLCLLPDPGFKGFLHAVRLSRLLLICLELFLV